MTLIARQRPAAHTSRRLRSLLLRLSVASCCLLLLLSSLASAQPPPGPDSSSSSTSSPSPSSPPSVSSSASPSSPSPSVSYNVVVNTSAKFATITKDFPNAAYHVEALGSFPSLQSMIYPGSTSTVYLNWWQSSLPIGFSFPFFGRLYTTLTITSKGYVLLGDYNMTDVDNLQPAAPDYLTRGFPLDRPVISVFHTPGMGVLSTNTMNNPGDESVSITAIIARTLGPVGTSYTPSRAIPPTFQNLLLNSPITEADGQRFMIYWRRVVDQTGYQVEAVTLLTESGIISQRLYSMSAYVAADGYEIPADGEASVPVVSMGIQGGSGQFVSAPALSQVTFETVASSWVGADVSFIPVH